MEKFRNELEFAIKLDKLLIRVEKFRKVGSESESQRFGSATAHKSFTSCLVLFLTSLMGSVT